MNMRIGGLASGMDIDSLVKDLMNAERMPLNKLNQQKTFLEWQRDDYRKLNTDLFNFSNSIFDGVLRQSTYTKKNITTTNSAIANIKSVSSTSDFNGEITVTKLAKTASINSVGAVAAGTTLGADENFTIQAIKKDGTLGEAITIEGKAGDSISTIVNKINSNKDVGVTAFFDEVTGRLSLTAKNSGNIGASGENNTTADAEIVITGTEFRGMFRLNGYNTTTNGTVGENAEFTYNGLSTSRSTNTFTINGVEFNLKGVGTTSFSSTTDVDSIFDSVKKFVDDYNKLIEDANSKINERRNRNFQPLTDEEREALSEKEAERWDEQARKGTMYGDSVIRSGLTQMRADLYSPIKNGGSPFAQLAELGITTSPNFRDGGKLIIDETKLREAISADPDKVYQTFAKDGTTFDEKGIARRLRETVQGTIKTIEQKAGRSTSTNSTFTIGRTLTGLDSQIQRFEDRLLQIEDRYWRQFGEMEKAIQRANSQSAYLMQQFMM
ncbi:flagellar hook-associated protein 2 [Mangrovibacillus cuniculi]|uniref:Flagellar hook-associated protein 2 n=1 Tax=Mangrovibacillus cuniculi TaxID=2593652 RepID=A0A7S8CCZ2_9BACI|nr:flagellar hook-associated protein 2 [Mangrovibacillus cuniculi]QPC47503.1 flagellar hook-associated protein 2 [Mangrovibacillus cuniculi]